MDDEIDNDEKDETKSERQGQSGGDWPGNEAYEGRWEVGSKDKVKQSHNHSIFRNENNFVGFSVNLDLLD